MSTIEVRNHWLYNDTDDCICCPGNHCFATGAEVVSSDAYPVSGDDVNSHVQAALREFGDNAELVIEIRVKG